MSTESTVQQREGLRRRESAADLTFGCGCAMFSLFLDNVSVCAGMSHPW